MAFVKGVTDFHLVFICDAEHVPGRAPPRCVTSITANAEGKT